MLGPLKGALTGEFQGSILVAPGVGRATMDAASDIRELGLKAWGRRAIQRPVISGKTLIQIIGGWHARR